MKKPSKKQIKELARKLSSELMWDIMMYGRAFTKNGKRVDVKEIPQEELNALLTLQEKK